MRLKWKIEKKRIFLWRPKINLQIYVRMDKKTVVVLNVQIQSSFKSQKILSLNLWIQYYLVAKKVVFPSLYMR